MVIFVEFRVTCIQQKYHLQAFYKKVLTVVVKNKYIRVLMVCLLVIAQIKP